MISKDYCGKDLADQFIPFHTAGSVIKITWKHGKQTHVEQLLGFKIILTAVSEGNQFNFIV